MGLLDGNEIDRREQRATVPDVEGEVEGVMVRENMQMERIRVVMIDDAIDKKFDTVGIFIDSRQAVEWAQGILDEVDSDWWDWDKPLYLYMRNASVKLGESPSYLRLSIAEPDVPA